VSYLQALRAISAAIDAAWAPSGFQMLWANKTTQIPAGNPTAWARTKVESVKGEQRTISQPTQLYTQRGTAIIQIFTPPGAGMPTELQAQLVGRIEGALRGKQLAGGVFFINVSRAEIGISGGWFQTNVSAIWQYDERTEEE
jgi:hypothetical protein